MYSRESNCDKSAQNILILGPINSLLTYVLKQLLILAVAVLVLDVLWGVFSRFVLNAQSSWTEELARFLLVWVTMLGSSLAFRQKLHLGVDVLTAKFDELTQLVTALLVDWIVLFFAVYIFFYGGALVLLNSVDMQQTMIALPFPKSALYFSLPFTGLLTVLFLIEDVCKKILQIAGVLKQGKNNPSSGSQL